LGLVVHTVTVAVHLRSPLGSGRETERKWDGEREGGSEVSAWSSTVSTHARRGVTSGAWTPRGGSALSRSATELSRDGHQVRHRGSDSPIWTLIT
jgi:hypothetical protein